MKKPIIHLQIITLLLATLFFSGNLLADDSPAKINNTNGEITDIKIVGLKHILAKQVFSQIDLDIQKSITKSQIAAIIKKTYKLGYFADVRAYLKDGVLFLAVKERQLISKMEIKGNKLIPTEAIKKSLKSEQIAVGKLFTAHAINKVIEIIRSGYEEQGYFNVEIDINTEETNKNYIGINISIKENNKLSLEKIIFVGNKQIKDEDLLRLMELKHRSNLSFFTKTYNNFQLTADLKSIKNHYLSHGFLDFDIISHEVKITPDKKGIYIIVSIFEGKQYRVSDVKLAGNYVLPAKKLLSFVSPLKNTTYNENDIRLAKNSMLNKFKNMGYLNAEINTIKKLDTAGSLLKLIFSINLKQRQLVRYITFEGNKETTEDILRKQIRQFENTIASQHLINLSKRRLNQLGYFSSVELEIIPVKAGVVDLKFILTEQKRQSIALTLSYSSVTKASLGGSYKSVNVFGTGQDIDLSFSYGEINQNARLSHYIPAFLDSYYSLRTSIFYTNTNLNKTVISNYNKSSSGLSVAIGYAIAENQRIEYGLSFEKSNITLGASPGLEITDYTERHGVEYKDYLLSVAHRYSSLNKGFLPTDGLSVRSYLGSTLPFSDIKFITASFSLENYTPILDNDLLTWKLYYSNKHGIAYGDTDHYPFYRYFLAGGLQSVRGYNYAGIGPRSKNASGNLSLYSFGGNTFINFRNSLIFASEGMKEKRMRITFFVDAGNSFNTNCILKHDGCDNKVDLSKIRSSYGVGLVWYTVIAPLSFSYAKPLNPASYNREEIFQFGLGVASL